MKRKKIFSLDVLLIFFILSTVVLAVLLCIANPVYLLPAGLLLLLLLVLLILDVTSLRRGLRKLLGAKEGKESEGVAALGGIGLPAAVVSNGRVVWYNNAFRQGIAGGADVPLAEITALAPGLDLRLCKSTSGQNMESGERKFSVYASNLSETENDYLLLFVENTTLKYQAAEYLASRPSVMYISIDTYDEILKQMRESERAAILSDINTALEKYIEHTNGFLRRVNSSTYIAIVEERNMAALVNARFDILDTVREMREQDAVATLSVGVGRLGESFRDCEAMAQQALDMALGRGGDQAAVKTPDGYTFYGGVSRSVEKRTRVKSRTMANAIRNLVQQSDRVLIMGHKQSDMDCVGAAVGMLRFCKICGKPAAIVLNENTTMAGSLVAYLNESGYADDILPPEIAQQLAGPKTLLIVVDTHMKYLLESEAIYAACGQVVVVDHHRRMVGHIDNAVIFYHEPYASSASELVSELLLYLSEAQQAKPTPAEAEALLAGIMLDTRTFSLHVGVRTFEAAAYLRRMGARTEVVKRMFASTLEDYMHRSRLVEQAEIYEGCAVVASEKVTGDVEVVTAQAANDLLTIEGVQASFVAVQQDKEIRVSARSMGEVNVQVIMEKLGGGGHLTMAGAQVKDATLEQVRGYILEAIHQYRADNTAANTDKK